MDTIDKFASHYRRELDFYDRLASLCASRCREMCLEAGVKAIVSYRAKSPDGLEKKIRTGEQDKGHTYADEEEIRSDIVDLSGVRIALYFPDDEKTVQELVPQSFDLAEDPIPCPKQTPSPTNDQQGYKKLFPGYKATHFRVRLPKESLSHDDVRYAEHIVEVQVATVFMHAWSEVEHELVYKNSSGEALSEAEYQILDQLNGLALAGELALRQLRRAIISRNKQKGQRFRDRFELRAFIVDELTKHCPERTIDSIGSVDVLYEFLRLADLLEVSAVRGIISRIDLQTEEKEIAALITARMLEDDPKLYESYRLANVRVANPPPDHYYLGGTVSSLADVPKGCLIKSGGEQLYWYTKHGGRLVIPNGQTFDTWFPSSGPKPRVTMISDVDLSRIPIGGLVQYRPGTRLLRIHADPKIYAVSRGGCIRWISSNELGARLFGSDWKERLVDVIPDQLLPTIVLVRRLKRCKIIAQNKNG